MSDTHPTIAALATPAGKSGVAVIRISGPNALDALLRLSHGPAPKPRFAALRTLYTAAGEIIDHALTLYFPAPHSFTGEDVVELHTHGSHAVIKTLLAEMNLPAAEAGEFTRRALYNGKLELLQVEALADLIDAQTDSQRAQALRQYSTATTRKFEALRNSTIEILALVEAYIDFPEEDIPESVTAQARTNTQALIAEIETLLADNGVAERIRDGFKIVLLGAPNAGKSSLLNALAGRDVAIVSTIAGTTRDVLEAQLDIGGFAVTVMDTAGLRETAEEIEALGIEKAINCAVNADIILQMSAPSLPAPPLPKTSAYIIELYNKSDLFPSANPIALPISAKTGEGIDHLIDIIKEYLETRAENKEHLLITRKRHREALQAAVLCLKASLTPLPFELWCEELRLAAREIGKITGKIDVDSVLDVVFSRFCIGK